MIKYVQKGFTLIELVVVIVILGILSAVAVPQFVNMRSEAIKAAGNGLAGAVASAAELVHSYCLTQNPIASPVILPGSGASVAVTTAAGVDQCYPLAGTGGIVNAVQVTNLPNFGTPVQNTTVSTVWSAATAIAGCSVTYTTAGHAVTSNLTAC